MGRLIKFIAVDKWLDLLSIELEWLGWRAGSGGCSSTPHRSRILICIKRITRAAAFRPISIKALSPYRFLLGLKMGEYEEGDIGDCCMLDSW